MKQIVFTKYSAERSKKFAIRTDIIKVNKDLFAVEKCGLYPEGEAHIKNIFRWYQLLKQEYKEEQFVVNRCEETAAGIRLEYLSGETLQQKIENLKEQKQEAEIEVYIEQYLRRMTEGHKWKSFQKTEEFCEVFGDVSLPEKLQCQEVTNIDMIFSNILLDGETWHFIDYEWTFTFPIPIHFVLYRAFLIAASEIPGVKVLDVSNMMQRLGIGIEEQQAYQKMEAHFQEYVRGGEKPLRDIIRDMGYPAVPMEEIERAFQPNTLPGMSVKYCTKEGWQRQVHTIEQQNIGSDMAKILLPVITGDKELEIQIAGGSCLMLIKQLLIKDIQGNTEVESVNGLAVNGMDLGGGLYIVLSESVDIRIPCDGMAEVEMTFQVQNLQVNMNQALVQQLSELYGTRTALQQENNLLRERYGRLEGNLLFQIYQKVLSFLRRIKRKL